MNKIYTKTGDAGFTSLVGGKRVEKCNPLIEAYGTIDELNAAIGLVLAYERNDFLLYIQNKLFTLGGMLATTPDEWFQYWNEQNFEKDIQAIENEIDTISESLEPLKSFLLPNGSLLIAQLHVSRTICRRAERLIVALTLQNPCYNSILQFINRLSDYFFILARFYHNKNNIPETYCVLNK